MHTWSDLVSALFLTTFLCCTSVNGKFISNLNCNYFSKSCFGCHTSNISAINHIIMSRATSPVDLKPVLHVDIMMDDWLDTLVNPPEQPSITGSASVAQSPSDLNDHDIRNRPSTSKRAIEADLEDATKTTARGPQKRQKTKMKPDAVIADLLMRIENLKGTTVIKRVQTDTVSSVDVNCPKPSLHTATVVNQRRTKTEIDKDEQRDEGNVADELRDLRHEHQQDMKEIRSDIQRNNAELRAAMAANETAQTNRYHELMGNFQQLMEQFETIKEQNSKTARITKEIQLTLLTSSLEGGSCDITEDQNFVAPKWPLSTAEQVLELNTKLQALEYRDQVVSLISL